jgi:hypothetical protein
VSILGERMQTLVHLNPMTDIVAGYQGILLHGSWPPWQAFVPQAARRARAAARSCAVPAACRASLRITSEGCRDAACRRPRPGQSTSCTATRWRGSPSG